MISSATSPTAHRPRLRSGLASLAGVIALAGLAACGDDTTRAADPTADATSRTSPSAPYSEDADGQRTFTATDYTYRLEVICFCPLTGPVDVTVTDGEVSEALVADTERAEDPGAEAPDYTRLTIADILERAADPSLAEAEIRWPDDSDHPTMVAIDQAELAVDDEITYRITGLELPS